VIVSNRELKDLWNERVREAHVQASKEFRATWGEHFENRLNDDSNLAIVLARRQESEPLAEYVRVLKIFSELVLSGKEPHGA
jgi:hypothetical protein